MLRSEKRSLIRFLVIYLLSTLLLFSLASWIFYTSSKHQLLHQQRQVLKYESQKLKNRLRLLHQSNDDLLYYPDPKGIQTAIYDKDKKYIFGTYPKEIPFDREIEEILYQRGEIEPYYLGAAYMLLAKPVDFTPIYKLQKNILFFMLIAGVVFSVLGYFLGRLFVKPMRESLNHMNYFIQDTTHELNTPISTILTNIEMIDTFSPELASTKELKRIEIASKTLSRIYDDLTYLNLNHHYHRKINALNISVLVEERIDYFSSMSQAKEIQIECTIVPDIILHIDKNDALRLIDNLISNAIKYNRHKGKLEIHLDHEKLVVLDSGIGIAKESLDSILQRFKRANKSEGGFGIGLHIVSEVCKNYDYILDIYSVIHKGTKVVVKWSR